VLGFGALGEFALGEAVDSTVTTYEPVSRIMAGGWSNGRPAEVAVLGVDLLWDDEQEIIWDNDENIGWEA
jgi:hypothetical protein